MLPLSPSTRHTLQLANYEARRLKSPHVAPEHLLLAIINARPRIARPMLIEAGVTLGGNEVEGILVRALRIYELSPEPRPPLKQLLAEAFREMRPSAHTRKLEYMDLVGVKECTDARFLPPRYRDTSPEELEQRIDDLRRFV